MSCCGGATGLLHSEAGKDNYDGGGGGNVLGIPSMYMKVNISGMVTKGPCVDSHGFLQNSAVHGQWCHCV